MDDNIKIIASAASAVASMNIESPPSQDPPNVNNIDYTIAAAAAATATTAEPEIDFKFILKHQDNFRSLEDILKIEEDDNVIITKEIISSELQKTPALQSLPELREFELVGKLGEITYEAPKPTSTQKEEFDYMNTKLYQEYINIKKDIHNLSTIDPYVITYSNIKESTAYSNIEDYFDSNTNINMHKKYNLTYNNYKNEFKSDYIKFKTDATSHFKFIPEFIKEINNINSISPLGTLDFTDKIAKIDMIDSTCRMDIAESLKYSFYGDYDAFANFKEITDIMYKN
jgi:hypothetical protein